MSNVLNLSSILIASVWFYFLFNLLNEKFSIYFWWSSDRIFIFYALHYLILLSTALFILGNLLKLFNFIKSDEYSNIFFINSLTLITLTIPHTSYFAYTTYYISVVSASFYQLLLSVSLLFISVFHLFSTLRTRIKS